MMSALDVDGALHAFRVGAHDTVALASRPQLKGFHPCLRNILFHRCGHGANAGCLDLAGASMSKIPVVPIGCELSLQTNDL